MDDTQLLQQESDITNKYRAFLAQVREAFNKHCDDIKEDATKKFNAVPEEDQDGRKKILTEQKAELDKTLAELKDLLSKKGAEVRTQLEEIANLRDQQSFNLDSELEGVEQEKAEKTA